MSIFHNREVANNEKAADNIKISELITLALRGVALAMGVAVVVLSFLNEIGTTSAIGMLGLGLACLAVTQFSNKDNIHGE